MKSAGPVGVTENDTELRNEFVELCLEYQELGLSVPVKLIPFSDSSVPHFSHLITDQKRRVLSALRNSVAICHQVLASGQKLNESRSLTWNALKYFGLIPSSDLFGKITETDVVEIYDMEHVQIFRNFQFFEYCSYTIEDVFCRPWQELFIRYDTSVTEKLLACLGGLLSNPKHETVATHVGSHLIEESSSVFRHKLDVDVKYLSLLYGVDHKPQAYLAVETAKYVSRPDIAEQNERLEAFAPKSGPNLTLIP